MPFGGTDCVCGSISIPFAFFFFSFYFLGHLNHHFSGLRESHHLTSPSKIAWIVVWLESGSVGSLSCLRKCSGVGSPSPPQPTHSHRRGSVRPGTEQPLRSLLGPLEQSWLARPVNFLSCAPSCWGGKTRGAAEPGARVAPRQIRVRSDSAGGDASTS